MATAEPESSRKQDEREYGSGEIAIATAWLALYLTMAAISATSSMIPEILQVAQR